MDTGITQKPVRATTASYSNRFIAPISSASALFVPPDCENAPLEEPGPIYASGATAPAGEGCALSAAPSTLAVVIMRQPNRKAKRRAAMDATFAAQLTKERTEGLPAKYLSAHARGRLPSPQASHGWDPFAEMAFAEMVAA